MLDRLKAAFISVARGANPEIDYMRLYRALVVGQSKGLNRVDVHPFDPRLPPMANVPLRTGVPGVDVKLKLREADGKPVGSPPKVLVGWENGRPDRPFAALWLSGAEGVARAMIEKVIFNGLTVELGGPDLNPALDGVVRAATPCQFTGAPHFVGGKTSLVVLAKEK